MARTALALLLALAVLAPIWGENRALVVVVEHYENVKDIASISLDIGHAVEILKLMGFKESQIKILRNSPKKSQIKSAFRSWLINGSSPGDTVAFYFSGHGDRIIDRNGDESDGCDEFLVPADFRYYSGGYADRSTSFIDDELHELIQELAGRKVLILVDSCHSGTITKGMRDLSYATPKFIMTKDQQRCTRAFKAIEIVEDVKGVEYLELSASQPDEVSWSLGGKGGVFTYYFLEGLRGSADLNGDGKITAREIAEYVAKKSQQLASSTSSIEPQHPHVEGSLASRDLLSIASARPSTEHNTPQVINKLDRIVQQSNFRVEINAQSQYRVGEYIYFNISSPKTGYYITMLSVEPTGKVILLFPNQWNRMPIRMSSSSITLPSDAVKPFKYKAKLPAGKSYIYVFLTPKPLNYQDKYIGGILEAIFKTFQGEDAKNFVRMLEKDLRAIGIEGPRGENDYGAGKITIEVVE